MLSCSLRHATGAGRRQVALLKAVPRVERAKGLERSECSLHAFAARTAPRTARTGFSAFTRASDDRDTSPTPRRYSLRDCADRFDMDVPQAATPG